MNFIKRNIQISLDESSHKKRYYLFYTFVFLATAFFVYLTFVLTGRSLVKSGDAQAQHIRALTYYGRYLRKILKTLLTEHKLVIPQWDFCIGEGADILSTLHYYVIGDPIALLSVFVPSAYTYILYSFSVILRLYFAGLAFSALCFEIGQKNRTAILAGAISYVFCYWALEIGALHIYFLSPLIYFPMLIWGVERVLNGKSGFVFILAVLLAGVSNFYFFYMLAILTVVYALIRIFTLYRKELKKALGILLRLLGFAVIGAVAAGAILVPIVLTFLQDSRMALQTVWHLLYPLKYYQELPAMLLSTKEDYYLYLGYSAPVILSLFLLFRKKGDRLLKILCAVSLVILLFPLFGQFLNGMSYRANRWCWAAALLCCVIPVIKWEELTSLTQKDGKYLFLCAGGYYLLCLLLNYSRSTAAFANLCLIFAAIALLTVVVSNKKRRQNALLLITLFAVIVNGFFLFANENGTAGYVDNMLDADYVTEKVTENETTALKMKKLGGAQVRYSGPSITRNANLLAGVSSTSYYWSITNPKITEFRTELEMREDLVSMYRGYDDRTELLTLASNDYYVQTASDSDLVPYGYSFVGKTDIKKEKADAYKQLLTEELGTEPTEEQLKKLEKAVTEKYWIYKNDCALPLGYCYDTYIDGEQWQSLSAVEKQKQMMTAVYLSEASEAAEPLGQTVSVGDVPFEITEGSDEITYRGNTVVTTAADQTLTLSFEGISNAETYLELSISGFDSTDRYELYSDDAEKDPKNLYNRTTWELLSQKTKDAIRKEHLYWYDYEKADLACTASNGISKEVSVKTADHSFTSGRTDYLINFGYSEDAVTTVTVTFPYRGVYTVDGLKIICEPMSDYEENVAALQAHVLENVSIGTDTVSGTLDLEKPMVLCLAVPYADGWKAYVDGAETDIMTANGRYMGIDVSEGHHEIEFTYGSASRNLGLAVTAVGIVAIAGYLGIYSYKKKRISKKEA